MAVTDLDRQELQSLMQRIEQLESLANAIKSRELFAVFEVESREQLAALKVPPPAIAYVRQDANYYFKYPYSADLADTPYNSAIGDGWHNIDSPTPRYDRMIHIVKTQWLNGWNLDYYPDYIDNTQGGRDDDYLKDVFGVHYGPPDKDAVTPNLPKFVTLDGAASAGDTDVYIVGLDKAVNALCTFTINAVAYSVVAWDTNNAIPHWISISPGLETDVATGTAATVEWPSIEARYTGVLAADAQANATTIEIRGIEGPIDTSYVLTIAGSTQQIIDYSPQGKGTLPDTLEISPGLPSDLPEETPWAMTKLKGKYNTEINNMRPGDLIFRSQIWKGTCSGASVGDTEINITGIQTEIADRWNTSHDIPPEKAERQHAQQGSILYIEDAHYDIVDHEPNARSQRAYTYGDRGMHDPNNPGWDDLLWKPTGLPTTKLFLRTPLTNDIPDGTEIIIKNKHWYVVSVEHLGSNETSTDFGTPRFCEGHKRDCFDFFHIVAGIVPARFELMLHSVASEEVFDALFAQRKIIPGDIVHHQKWHNWYQVLPSYQDGELETDRVAFGDFARTITVHDRDEFDFFSKHFEFNNLWVINHTHGRQAWTRNITTGFDADGNLTSRTWQRFRYHPAEFVLYPGSPEESVR